MRGHDSYRLFTATVVYSYWLGSWTTAVLFDARTDLLPSARGFGQQIRFRVKQNCCCPRSQSITVLLYTIIFFKFFYSLFPLTSRPSSQRIWKTPRHCNVNITWLIEPMKIRSSVNSSIAGNRSMNCWPVNRTVLQPIGILLLTVKILCIYCIAFIQEKNLWCITIYNIDFYLKR